MTTGAEGPERWEARLAALWRELDVLDGDRVRGPHHRHGRRPGPVTAEVDAASDDLDGAVAVAVSALATYLPRYNRSAARYAQELLGDEAD